VEQDAPVLAGTLRENLVFAAPGATDDDIRDVLARTKLDTLVERLPHDLDTPVGHRGSKLSGGERQRIAIARALLRRLSGRERGRALADEALARIVSDEDGPASNWVNPEDWKQWRAIPTRLRAVLAPPPPSIALFDAQS
jgi:ABC-type uncharacterized transport system YnjBCD ATPase subunit